MLNENQEQTRNLAVGCSKHSLEVVDKTDEVSSKHGFEVVDKAKLTWFEEIFEEYKKHWSIKVKILDLF
ncbi:hypothetical protein OK463_00120 [Streptococcus pneumoniae]|uniref:hypothetical protein n=1 Tax=Streptococcus pneumoniae TaxID=1313 RepID=UPI0010E7149C|nr:hypothetical protein [Streptococcus pneumoniae]MDG7586534.1 hypothetical protein [Streptococcus pneumoniae]MDG7823068.1 hypothetical protein [Streptococcus pneumoniae]MDG8134576.1 hypothetical protein [Streptococcus pneumoniae]MDG8583127.1 hypothetical protein [Streptococcus pneumoniae]MDG8731043.1 hypothetical protein [Streptococcus pneumoniae]